MHTYEAEMQRMLAAICEEAETRGHCCSAPYDVGDEEYKWAVLVVPEGGDDEDGVDVTVTMVESEVTGYTEGGVSVSVDLVAFEGEVLGRAVDPGSVVDYIAEWAGRAGAKPQPPTCPPPTSTSR